MEHRLAGIASAIGHEAVTVFADILFFRQFPGNQLYLAEQSAVLQSYLVHAGYVLRGNYQYMHRRLRGYVPESHDIFVLKNYLGRYLFFCDLAEKTVQSILQNKKTKITPGSCMGRTFRAQI